MKILKCLDWKYKWLLLALIVLGCEPTALPDPKDDGPSFFAEMEIEGETVYLGSGKDEVFNFSLFESGPANSIRLSSIFQKDTCDYPCPSSFRVDIYGFEAWLGGKVDPAVQFKPGVRTWVRPNESEVKWKFNALLNNANSPNSNATVKWTLNGTEIDNDKTELTDLVVDSSGRFNLCASVTRDFNIYQQICAMVNQFNVNPMEVIMRGQAEGRDQLKYIAEVKFGQPPYKYIWNGIEGDRMISERVNKDTTQVMLKVVDALGNEVEIKNTALAKDSMVFPMNAIMKLEAERIIQAPVFFGKTVLRWVDRNGVEYASAFGAQGAMSRFEIDNFQFFRPSPSENPLAKVKMRFESDLYDRSGNKKSIRNGKATMVFRYPD